MLPEDEEISTDSDKEVEIGEIYMEYITCSCDIFYLLYSECYIGEIYKEYNTCSCEIFYLLYSELLYWWDTYRILHI